MAGARQRKTIGATGLLLLSVLRYFFPTYENDALLCTLSDSDEDQRDEASHGEDIPVIAEDISNLRELKQTSVLNQLLKNRSSCS